MGLLEEFASFGTDWLYVAVPSAIGVAIAVALVVRAGAPAGRNLVVRFADGAADVAGLPSWAAGTLTALIGILLMAFSGFLWDVGWHITVGRDEFLFSPPHVQLLIGTAGMGVAGAIGVHVATRTDAPVGWQLARWRVPFGALALLVAGSLAIVGYWIDEFWHAIYGLDVTMWSPPHMLMISSAVFSPMAGWLVLSEASTSPDRRGAPRTTSQRIVAVALPALLAGAVLEGLSAWQLEYDFGVSQWSTGAQVVLIALAASMALLAAREVIGRGGALLAVAVFLGLRGLGAIVTAQVWSLEVPRFPLYLAAAVAVEVVFLATRGRSPLVRALVGGAAVGTFGMAGEWLWSNVWGYHPWNTTLWPELGLALVVAVAVAPLAIGFGRVLAGRPVAITGRVTAICLVVIGVAVAPTLQRTTPSDVQARVTSTPAGDDLVDVTVEVSPVDAVVDADRFEVFQWQGGERTLLPLRATDVPGTYTTDAPVPIGGERKAFVLLVDGSDLGAVPIRFPADLEIGASRDPPGARPGAGLRRPHRPVPPRGARRRPRLARDDRRGGHRGLHRDGARRDHRRDGRPRPSPRGDDLPADRRGGRRDRAARRDGEEHPMTAPEHHEVVIVGTGFAGLGIAIQLREAGVRDLVLLDRGHDVGGTWRDNHYPGAACDVPSNLYSFSFAPNPDWTRSFSPQPEILAYLRRLADDRGVAPLRPVRRRRRGGEVRRGDRDLARHDRDRRRASPRGS